MSHRTSPMKVKQHAARLRLAKLANKTPEDPNVVRELSRERAEKVRPPVMNARWHHTHLMYVRRKHGQAAYETAKSMRAGLLGIELG